MAITVQTDMATPALARFGSDALRQEFLTPAIAGDIVAAIGVSEPHAGSAIAFPLSAYSSGEAWGICGTIRLGAPCPICG